MASRLADSKIVLRILEEPFPAERRNPPGIKRLSSDPKGNGFGSTCESYFERRRNEFKLS
jgi:hypothetical protein